MLSKKGVKIEQLLVLKELFLYQREYQNVSGEKQSLSINGAGSIKSNAGLIGVISNNPQGTSYAPGTAQCSSKQGNPFDSNQNPYIFPTTVKVSDGKNSGFMAGALRFVEDIFVSTYNDGKTCIKNGGVQECLSSCGIALDITGIGAPVAMACDGTNSLIYLFKGEKLMAGASAIAIIPFIGSIGKSTAKTTIKLTAEEAARVGVRAGAKTLVRSSIKIADEYGGHAFARHIAITDQGLKNRIVNEGIPYASRFISEDVADNAIRDLLMGKQDEIVKWIKDSSKKNLDISGETSENIGYGYKKVGESLEKVSGIKSLSVTLQRNGDDFFVLTAFPDMR